MPLSTAALVYLGADAVVPKDKKLSMGLDVPCRDASVDLKTASGVLLAASFAALRDAGAVTVGVERKKGLLGGKDRVAVRPAGGGAPAGPVEAGLLGALAEKDPYARDTVWRWIGRESANPWGGVVAAVEAELVEAGLLAPVEAAGLKGKLSAMSAGRVKTEPDCAAVGAVRGDVEAALARWRAFADGDRALADALVSECRAGVDRRLAAD